MVEKQVGGSLTFNTKLKLESIFGWHSYKNTSCQNTLRTIKPLLLKLNFNWTFGNTELIEAVMHKLKPQLWQWMGLQHAREEQS